jgi:hypothetical protein
MKKTMTLVAALALVTSPAAAQLYNPNPYAPQPQQASPRYNPFNNNWEMTYPNSQLNYNPFSNNWQYTAPNAQPQFNPFSGNWEYPH